MELPNVGLLSVQILYTYIQNDLKFTAKKYGLTTKQVKEICLSTALEICKADKRFAICAFPVHPGDIQIIDKLSDITARRATWYNKVFTLIQKMKYADKSN